MFENDQRREAVLIMHFGKCILVLAVLFMHLMSSQIFAQGRWRNYQHMIDAFLPEIAILDPIEGIYDLSVNSVGYGGYKSLNLKQHFTVIIVDNEFPKDTFTVYALDGDFEGLLGYMLKRGGNSYTFVTAKNRTLQQHTFQLRDIFFFTITEEENYGYYGRETKNEFVKIYPTSAMYAEAERKLEEEVRRAEEERNKPTNWSGSGFALNRGYIATNYHIIEDAKSIKVSGINGNYAVSYNASVVATDKENDLAIIKINDSQFKGFGVLPYRVNTQMAEVGDDVFVLGYPLTQTMGDEIKLTNGIISARTGFQGSAAMYQMSAPIQPGNSGGPMFDSKGNVIGVVCAHHAGTENVGYAIKTSYLKNLAETVSLSNIFPTSNTVSTLPLSGQVKKLKNFVYIINCSR